MVTRTSFGIMFIGLFAFPMLMATAYWTSLGPPDPSYDGKPLSIWLQGYDDDHNGLIRTETDETIRKIGTNGIPLLLKWLRATDSPLSVQFFEQFERQDWVKIPHTPAEVLNIRAICAFNALGSEASNAVPELIGIFSQNKSMWIQWQAADLLAHCGPAASDAIPLLLIRTGHTNRYLKGSAIWALGEIHSHPETVVPRLEECLHDPDPDIPFGAAIALGKFGPAAKSAAPFLLER